MEESREVPPPHRPPTRKRVLLLLLAGLSIALSIAACAIVIVNRQHAESPDDLDAEAPDELALAVAAFEANDLKTVQRYLEKFQSTEAFRPHAKLLAGMLLLRQGKLFEAIDSFGFANEHPDTKALAYAYSGEALYKAGIFRDADRILTMAIQLDPANINNHRYLAATYYDIGAMHHALAQLSIVAEQDPKDPRPNRLRGLIFRDYENYDEAVGEYRQSLQRSRQQPDLESILFELAECLVKLRRYSEAQEVLTECRPSPDVWAAQAECYFAFGQVDKARELLNQALSANAEHVGASVLAATIAIKESDMQRAAEVLESAAAAHPKEYLVQYKLAEVYRLLGDQDKANKQAELAEGLRELRTKFTKLHDQAMADAADAEIRYQLGLAAVELEKWKLAISWFRAALALDPEHHGAAESLRKLTSLPGSRAVKPPIDAQITGEHDPAVGVAPAETPR